MTGESCPNAHTVWHGISAFPCKFRRLLQLLVEKINADCSLEDFKKRKKFLFELSHSALRLCFCIVSDGNKARFHLCVKLQTYNFCVENTPEPRAVTKANCETVGKKKSQHHLLFTYCITRVSYQTQSIIYIIHVETQLQHHMERKAKYVCDRGAVTS